MWTNTLSRPDGVGSIPSSWGDRGARRGWLRDRSPTISTFEQESETTDGNAREYLARADDLDGFPFAVAESEDLDATIGRSDAPGNTLWLDQLRVVLVPGVADARGVHPAETGHVAIESALVHVDGG